MAGNISTWAFIIGSADDFESLDELLDYVEAHGHTGNRNYSVFEFDTPDELDLDSVTMIGRGYAFSADWCMDHTFSACIYGQISV